MTDQILKNLIDNDIFCNASPLIGDLLSNPDAAQELPGCDYDDLWSLATVPDYSEPPEGYVIGGGLTTATGERFAYFEDPDGGRSEEYNTETDAIRAAYEDSGEEPPRQEVFEHWIVSDALAEELERISAPVSHDVFGWSVWGRTETGQSLTMDSTLKVVAELIQARIDEAT